MTDWQLRPIPFKFQLSDWTLLSVSLPLQVRAERLVEQTPPVDTLTPPADQLVAGSEGFLIRGLPVAGELPVLGRIGEYLRYVPLQYQHCYIDLGMSFEQYQQKFSSKTRSTINRKVKKFREHSGGAIAWKTYRAPGEMREFFRHARAISKLTYQERLLDAGIPGEESFIAQAEALAASDNLRAYILFDGERPVSYLYCPVQDGVLVYAYLGYDPEYMQLSVGTVLQWLAIEQLFDEGCFLYFDFTEGQSDHKRLFATHQRQCANVYILRNTLGNAAVIQGHRLMNRLSNVLGAAMDRLGVKAKLKRLLRGAGA
ncbi:MAG: GNAT family N-acetyltransferase [Thiobacillus sp.]|nr:GNAT family N-acetyltransferase [Thiobacillus sp.]